jgi:hypothetical protein
VAIPEDQGLARQTAPGADDAPDFVVGVGPAEPVKVPGIAVVQDPTDYEMGVSPDVNHGRINVPEQLANAEWKAAIHGYSIAGRRGLSTRIIGLVSWGQPPDFVEK